MIRNLYKRYIRFWIQTEYESPAKADCAQETHSDSESDLLNQSYISSYKSHSDSESDLLITKELLRHTILF